MTAATNGPAGTIENEACEINVAEHCNLRCRGCSHMSPVLPKQFVDPDEVYRDLSILARHYRAEHVRLLGGEPLLHPDLAVVAAAVRESGITGRVRVLTNGLLLPRAPVHLWRAVDEIHVSIYPGHELSRADLDRCTRQAAETRVELVIKRFGHFREAYSETGTSDEHLIREIYSTCQIAHVWRCHNVSRGYFFKCPQAIFLNRMFGRAHGTDGVRLVEGAELGGRLAAYLADHRPLAACSNCLGSVGRRYPHEQVARRGWRDHQRLSTEAMIDFEHLSLLEHRADADNRCVATTERIRPPRSPAEG